MSIDAIFFPCAGLGTRMGEVGKVIPKPLWPLFEKPLLEYKLLQFRKLGFKHFIINTHHCASKLDTFVSEFLHSNKEVNIEISYERELLGNGGSFHKISREFPRLNRILVSNPDTFYFLEKSDWDEFKNLSTQFDNVLIGVPCNKEASYNRLNFSSDGLYDSVVPPTTEAPNVTYSGMGIVNLKSFLNRDGVSSFFDTVVNKELNKTRVFIPKSGIEFWDFGTLADYKNALHKIKGGEGATLAKLITEIERKEIWEEVDETSIKDVYGDGDVFSI